MAVTDIVFYSCEQILRKGIFKQGQNDFVLVSQWQWILELNNGKQFHTRGFPDLQRLCGIWGDTWDSHAH